MLAMRSSWPLFVGMLFLMISNGLLATLLTLRGHGLGFDGSSIGLMQSAYPVGSIIGCLIAPRVIMNVGHIRTFAALASIASAVALVHLVTFDLWSWGLMRLLSGFCFSGLYIVAESWLNGSSTNKSRGSLLSVYFIVQTGGVTAGQLLLNLSSPDGILLFIIVSILISFSLVPMLISNSTSPPYELPERISLGELFRLTPMGLTGSFLNGISQTVLYVSLAFYGSAIGLASGPIGILVGCMALGGMLFQFPIGKLSDHIDRRLVIVGAPALVMPVFVYLIAMDNPADQFFLLCALITVVGGLTLPIYSLCMAHMHDYLKPEQVIAASGSLALTLAAGMTLGPTLGGFAIDSFGPQGMFYLLATVAVLTVTTTLFRLWHGQPRSENPGTAVALATNLSTEAAALYPDASGNQSKN